MYAASDILGTTALGSMKNVLILSLNNLVTPMKSDEYWQLRALQREADSHKDAASTALRLRALYERASKDLKKQIHKIFGAYVDYTGIDEQKARELLSVQESTELLEELRKRYEETSNAEALAKLNAPAYGYRISRLQAACRAVEVELDKLAAQEEKTGTRQLVDTYDKSYYKTAYDTLPELSDSQVAPLSQNVVEEAILNKWDGKNYSERVWKNRDKLAQEAGRIIDSSAASGASITQMTKELSDLLDVGSYVAARLIRTEVNRMHNNAALASYTAMGLKEYKYIATLDCRTCAVCGALDGKVFPIAEAHTGVNFPPIHPNDRCTITPVVPGVTESGSRTARNPETGRNYKVPADMEYKEWRKSISEKYGADSIQTAQKKYWNRKADTEQMKEIRKVLGKDVPNNIADFQNLKYNDADSWTRLQQAYKDRPIRNRIQSDAQPKVIDEGKQGKHILGDNNYQGGKSYLTISMEEAQNLVDKYAGTGILQRTRKGDFANRELIVADHDIGVNISNETGKKTSTNRFYIHYSKSGTHIVPTLKGADEE